MELQGQVALVTGGTAGIGLEAARLLAREGADVIITGRDGERGQRAAADVQEAGTVRFVRADLAELDSSTNVVFVQANRAPFQIDVLPLKSDDLSSTSAEHG